MLPVLSIECFSIILWGNQNQNQRDLEVRCSAHLSEAGQAHQMSGQLQILGVYQPWKTDHQSHSHKIESLEVINLDGKHGHWNILNSNKIYFHLDTSKILSLANQEVQFHDHTKPTCKGKQYLHFCATAEKTP
jgi:hypothetical protein